MACASRKAVLLRAICRVRSMPSQTSQAINPASSKTTGVNQTRCWSGSGKMVKDKIAGSTLTLPSMSRARTSNLVVAGIQVPARQVLFRPGLEA